MHKPPFFIIGCVRSGTTFLRDILRLHPNLACPEETHFYRYAEPFRVQRSVDALIKSGVLKKHREIDQISEEMFLQMIEGATSRAHLCNKYMQQYIAINKPLASRWFDKTPQNVYGANMIAMQFPRAKFIHIVRNPLDVISSLRIGKIVKVENLVGACNYWNEAVEIVQVLKMAFPKRVCEVKYEDFAASPNNGIKDILSFLDEEYDPAFFSEVIGTPRSYQYDELFTAPELERLRRLCSRWGEFYGYFPSNDRNA